MPKKFNINSEMFFVAQFIFKLPQVAQKLYLIFFFFKSRIQSKHSINFEESKLIM